MPRFRKKLKRNSSPRPCFGTGLERLGLLLEPGASGRIRRKATHRRRNYAAAEAFPTLFASPMSFKKYSWTRVSGLSSGWNDVPRTLPSRTITP